MPLKFCHPEAPHNKLRIPEWYISTLMLDRALDAIVRRVENLCRRPPAAADWAAAYGRGRAVRPRSPGRIRWWPRADRADGPRRWINRCRRAPRRRSGGRLRGSRRLRLRSRRHRAAATAGQYSSRRGCADGHKKCRGRCSQRRPPVPCAGHRRSRFRRCAREASRAPSKCARGSYPSWLGSRRRR